MSRPQILKHMAEKDIPLWTSYFLSAEGQAYTAWEFDVLVGDPEEPGPFFPMSARRQALYINALKIDAVGWFFSTPTLIECKPNASCSAIGQILVYQEWYRLIFGLQPSMMIVCRRMARQVQTYCAIEEIAVRIVEPADTYQITQSIQQVRPMIQVKSVLPQFQAASELTLPYVPRET